MKKIFVLSLLLWSSMAFAAEKVVHVNGMVCAFCAQGIEKKFKAEPAVESVEVSLKDKVVKLTFKEGQNLSDEKIKSILNQSGFAVVEK